MPSIQCLLISAFWPQGNEKSLVRDAYHELAPRIRSALHCSNHEHMVSPLLMFPVMTQVRSCILSLCRCVKHSPASASYTMYSVAAAEMSVPVLSRWLWQRHSRVDVLACADSCAPPSFFGRLVGKSLEAQLLIAVWNTLLSE